MKILHIAYSLSESSAATRISESTEGEHENIFYLGRKSTCGWVRNKQVNIRISSFIGVLFHLIDHSLSFILRSERKEVFSFGLFYRIQALFVKYLVYKYKVDVVHIHWGGYSFFPVEALNYIKKPIIITVHDYNYFTGGCHIPMSCNQYLYNCKNCPLVRKWSLSRLIVSYLRRRRGRVLLRNKNNIHVISPSNYTKLKLNSIYPFLSIDVIGNPLGSIYENHSLKTAISDYKKRLNSSSGYINVLFLSVFKSERDNKGYNTLVTVLRDLSSCSSVFNIEFTQVSGTQLPSELVNITSINYCSSKDLLKVYASADLCIVPSKFETFSQVTLEAISLGTPVIAFDLSGPKDIIVHNKSGFLVESFDELEFTKLIKANLNYKRQNIDNIYKASITTRNEFSSYNIARLYNIAYKKIPHLSYGH